MNTTEPARKRSAIIDNNENTGPDEGSVQGAFCLNGVLPLTRVKRIIKLSTMAETVNVSADATKLIQLCAEEYLRVFVRTTSLYAEQAGRKTIQLKDLNRVIKDDWAFALLEDALIDWPNDTSQQLQVTELNSIETNSSSFFQRNQPAMQKQVEPNTAIIGQDMVESEDDDINSEFNETGIFLDADEPFTNAKQTPKPTMEYLKPNLDDLSFQQCQLAEPLSFDDDDSADNEVDAQRPHNSRFLDSRRLDDDELESTILSLPAENES